MPSDSPNPPIPEPVNIDIVFLGGSAGIGPGGVCMCSACQAIRRQITPNPHSAEHVEVLDAMAALGGSFVVALAEAWRRADAENHLLLYRAFGHVYSRYHVAAAGRRDDTYKIGATRARPGFLYDLRFTARPDLGVVRVKVLPPTAPTVNGPPPPGSASVLGALGVVPVEIVAGRFELDHPRQSIGPGEAVHLPVSLADWTLVSAEGGAA